MNPAKLRLLKRRTQNGCNVNKIKFLSIGKSQRPGIKNANPGPGSYNAEKRVIFVILIHKDCWLKIRNWF